MKKLLSFVLLIYIFFFSIKLNVSAACNDEELKEYAKNFQARLITEEDYLNLIESESYKKYDYLLAFYPFVSEIKISVKEKGTNKSHIVNVSPGIAAYYIGENFENNERVLDINVYGSDGTACENELLLTHTYKIPKFNEYSLSEYCDNNKEDEKCNSLYDSSNLSFKEFNEYVNEQEEANNYKNMTIYQKTIKFIKYNWYFILMPILIISVIYIIAIRNYKKKVSEQ